MTDANVHSTHERVFIALQAVPSGRIISYGRLAKLALMPSGARQVGRILRELTQDDGLPWHRVVRSDGCIALPASSSSYARQIRLLQSEGVEVKNARVVKPNRYFWPH